MLGDFGTWDGKRAQTNTICKQSVHEGAGGLDWVLSKGFVWFGMTGGVFFCSGEAVKVKDKGRGLGSS